jgi:light-regulated signal transduction histidine kinase (bacteriophytochrome)
MCGKLLILPSVSYHNNEIEEIVFSYNKMVSHLDGTTTSIGKLNKEIAKQKLTEKELSKQRNHLTELVAERTASLEESNAKLAQSNTELQEFVYIASHDLQKPLQKISAFGKMVKDSLIASLEEDDKENLDFMIDGAERMTQMIEALLVYSRLSKNDITLSAVDLNEIIEQFSQLELAMLLEETNAAIDIPQTLPTVKADKVLIKQLIQILISNGIKYQKPGTAPRIEITAREIDNDKVRIEFKDNGIGIKKDMHQTIFKMFKRAHSNEEYQGKGIGLAVCKKIAESHGSQIGVDSEEGKGSVFWFTMPLEKEQATVT